MPLGTLISFSHSQYLWFGLALLPLLWLAWRVHRRRRVVAGTLFLWRLAQQTRPASSSFFKKSQWFLYSALISGVGAGVLALAGGVIGDNDDRAALVLMDENLRMDAEAEGVSRREEARRQLARIMRQYPFCEVLRRDFQNPANFSAAVAVSKQWRQKYPRLTVFWIGDRLSPFHGTQPRIIGKNGDNLALCRVEIIGGRIFATVGNFSAAAVPCRLEWSPGGEISSLRFQELRLDAEETRVIPVPVTDDEWRRGQGEITVRLRALTPFRDALPRDDVAHVRKIISIAGDLRAFPELAAVLRAAGTDILPVTETAHADLQISVGADGAGPIVVPCYCQILRWNPVTRRQTAFLLAPGGKFTARPGTNSRCRLKFTEGDKDAAFPLALLRWLDSLVNPLETASPAAHDCRKVPSVLSAQSGEQPQSAGKAFLPHIAITKFALALAALSAGGLAWFSWRFTGIFQHSSGMRKHAGRKSPTR